MEHFPNLIQEHALSISVLDFVMPALKTLPHAQKGPART